MTLYFNHYTAPYYTKTPLHYFTPTPHLLALYTTPQFSTRPQHTSPPLLYTVPSPYLLWLPSHHLWLTYSYNFYLTLLAYTADVKPRTSRHSSQLSLHPGLPTLLPYLHLHLPTSTEPPPTPCRSSVVVKLIPVIWPALLSRLTHGLLFTHHK